MTVNYKVIVAVHSVVVFAHSVELSPITIKKLDKRLSIIILIPILDHVY